MADVELTLDHDNHKGERCYCKHCVILYWKRFIKCYCEHCVAMYGEPIKRVNNNAYCEVCEAKKVG